ncbi:MAG: hypothetical protein IKL03_03565 [Bacteroidaceae bacterium]|nr:hypothetical protein [Bacteroidaceae bacterium]
MKRLLYLLVLFVTLFACNNKKSTHSSAAQTDSLLCELHERDQQIRHELMRVQRAFIAEQRAELVDSIVMLVEEEERTDSLNRVAVDSLLQNGWPEGLSEQSNQTIWLIIDHGDVEYQERYLPLIEQQAMRGIISLADYATLSDRVNVRRQRPQRYGTQTGYTQRDGETFTYVYPIEDIAKLDSLRLSVGLDSMHIYLRQVSETLGTSVAIDTALTWECID